MSLKSKLYWTCELLVRHFCSPYGRIESGQMYQRHPPKCALDAHQFAESRIGPYPQILWRNAALMWAVRQAPPGDVVECGTFKGYTALGMLHSMRTLPQTMRKMWLVDTFRGAPRDCTTNSPGALYYDDDLYPFVRQVFAPYPNVHVIQGRVPEVLPAVYADTVAVLNLDLNSWAPEQCAFEYFWPRIPSGGLIFFDDYSERGYEPQHDCVDRLCQKYQLNLLPLMSAAGLIVKP